MDSITLNDKSNRQYLIWKLNRDWPAMRYGLRNGRKLNRLSTKQLAAKLNQYQKVLSSQRSGYVTFLNSFQAVAA